MANEIAVGISLRCTKLGGTVSGSVSQTYDQVGNSQFENIQTIGVTTEPITLGDVAGEKFLMFRNQEQPTTANPAGTGYHIYIDNITPVVPATALIKLGPNGGNFQITLNDTWYAIAVGGSSHLLVVAAEA